MGRFGAWLLVTLLAVAPAWAEDPKVKLVNGPGPKGKVVSETWDIAILSGARAGYVHTTIEEINAPQGGTFLRAKQELNLSARRFDQLATVKAAKTTDETADGQLLGVYFTFATGKETSLVLEAPVKDDKFAVKLDGREVPMGKQERTIPGANGALGLISEQNFLKTQKAKPGDSLTYRLFEPTVVRVVKVQVTVKNFEKVNMNGVFQDLLRVEAKPEPIGGFQLPAQTLWVDKDYQTLKSVVEMPGLGVLWLIRGDEKAAKQPIAAEALPDIGKLQSLTLNQFIPDPHWKKSVVFRISLPEDLADDPSNAFANGDGRQEVKNVKGKTFELHIRGVREPKAAGGNGEVADEFIKSNYFLTSDDPQVIKHAKAAVGTEPDPWKKAKLIEAWVRKNMKVVDFSVAMAPASEVAKNLAGDCTEFSMLTAAMCKAEGIPARTALGYIYHVPPSTGKPTLAFHMWTEVLINGDWTGIDATIGYGSVGPAHIKITDHSWYQVNSMAPLLPVMRVMIAKPTIEVLRIEK
jgi:hypothetical protein